MKRRNKSTTHSEPLFGSWFDKLYNPTIEMAAELMNVSIGNITEWLEQEHLDQEESDSLSDAAIDFLSQKYVTRLHKYFDNCVASWDSLTPQEADLFSQFKRKYGKFYSFRVTKWKEIDTKHIIRDFKEELKRKAWRAFYEEFEAFEFPVITVTAREVDIYPIFKAEPKELLDLLYSVSRSLYYCSRIKTKIPARPEHRDINLETLQENRFHIFTGESEDNVQLDANSFYIKINQPQLAIAPVLGYQRHKDIAPNDHPN